MVSFLCKRCIIDSEKHTSQTSFEKLRKGLGTSQPRYGLFQGYLPMDDFFFFSVGYRHTRISPYSHVNFSKFSISYTVCPKGVKLKFCPRVGKRFCHPYGVASCLDLSRVRMITSSWCVLALSAAREFQAVQLINSRNYKTGFTDGCGPDGIACKPHPPLEDQRFPSQKLPQKMDLYFGLLFATRISQDVHTVLSRASAHPQFWQFLRYSV